MRKIFYLSLMLTMGTITFGQSYYTISSENSRQMIDSICSSLPPKYNLFGHTACSDTLTVTILYKDENLDTLIYKGGLTIDTKTKYVYLFTYNYSDKKLIKAEVTIKLHGLICYSAVYYFNNDKLLEVIGEDSQYSDTENILMYSKTGLWQPKTRQIRIPIAMRHKSSSLSRFEKS